MASTTPTAVDALFSKSLSTMVKGIRSSRDKAQTEYIGKCLAEIKKELIGSDPDDKTEALKKLIYLQLLGYDMSWAAFHIIEVMSLNWIGHKRVGYLAAALCFNEKTDVSLLATNLFKKAFQQSFSAGTPDIAEGIQYDVGAALSCFASIITPALANDLLNDVVALTNSSRPYIRKKAMLAMLRIFLKFPQALRMTFERVTEKLNDENPSVVSSVVYVLCELAARNPKNYLGLAPQFFQILTSSSNNWVLIKVVKLLGSLVPLEPRLAKKLQEPLTEIITTTPAKSLLYECINTLLSGQITSKAVVRLCLDKLREFIEAPDQNLKYLGLLGLHKLIQSFPRVVVEHKDLILSCLDDNDITLRMRALDLVGHLVTQRNLPGVVRRLVDHLHNSEGSYRDVVLSKIISICAQDSYAYVADFEWYLVCLLDLTRIPGASMPNARAIATQITELMIRVPELRAFGTAQLCDLICECRLMKEVSAAASLISPLTLNAETKVSRHATATHTIANHNYMSEVLAAAAFCVGEYAQHAHSHVTLLSCLLLHPSVPLLSAPVQAAFAQAVPKILASALQQPFFETAAEALKWEEQQKAAVAAASHRAAELKAESVLPADVDDPFAVNDSDGSDDDEEGFKGAHLAVTAVGHAAYVGRTTVQHATFLEQLFTVVLTGLSRMAKSHYMEVQERAAVMWSYCQWVAAHMGAELRINPSLFADALIPLPGVSDAVEAPAVAAEGKKDAAAEATSPQSAAKSPASTTSPKPNANALVDLTELLFGTDNTDIAAFDPLSYLNYGNNDSIFTAGSKPKTQTADAAAAPESLAAAKTPATTEVSISAADSRALSEDFVTKMRSLSEYFTFLIPEPLAPVGSKAQQKVPVPAGLDLDAPIFDEEEKDDEEAEFFTAATHPLFPIGVPKTATALSSKHYTNDSDDDVLFESKKKMGSGESSSLTLGATEEEKRLAKEKLQQRMKERESDPFYLGGAAKKSGAAKESTESPVGKKKADIDIDMSDVGKKSKARMKILSADSEEEDDDLFEGSALAVSNKKQKEKDNKKEKKEKKEKKDKKPVAAPVDTAPPVAAEPMPLGVLRIFDDENVAIYAQARPIPSPEGKPLLLLALTFDSKATAPMLQLGVTGNKKATTMVPGVSQPTAFSHCVAGEQGATLVQVKGLDKGRRVTAYLSAQWSDANISSSSLKFACNLKYVTPAGPADKNFEAVLPTSVFIAPEKLTMAQFGDILSHSETTCKASAVHTLVSKDVVSVLRGLEQALNVLLVEAVNRSAGYYGKCTTLPEGQQHVCVYAKCNGEEVVINVKTAHQVLSDKLVKDIVRLLG